MPNPYPTSDETQVGEYNPYTNPGGKRSEPDKGAFMSFLDWLGHTSQAGMQLAQGNPGAAGRHALDLLGEIPDAVLPGNAIPQATSREDYTSGSQLVGIDREKYPISATMADVGVGTALDPAAWASFPLRAASAAKGVGGGVRVGVPFTQIGKTFAEGADLNPLALAGKAAGAAGKTAIAGANKALDFLPQDVAQGIRESDTLKYVKKIPLNIRDTLGMLDVKPELQTGIQSAESLASNARRVGQDEVDRLAGGLTKDQDVLAQEIIENVRKTPDGSQVIGSSSVHHGEITPIPEQIAGLKAVAQQHPAYQALDDATKARVDSAMEDALKLGHTQYLEEIKGGVLAQPKGYYDQTGARFSKDSLEQMRQGEKSPMEFPEWAQSKGFDLRDIDVSNASPANYLHRTREVIDEPLEQFAPPRKGVESALKERSIKTPEQLAEFRNSEEGQKYTWDDSLRSRLLSRTAQSGQMRQRAALTKQIVGDGFKNLVEGVSTGDKTISARQAYEDTINLMAKTDPDSARMFANLYRGTTARHPIMEALATVNSKLFKPAAVFSVIVPKFESIVRNAFSGGEQVLSTQGAAAAGRDLLRLPDQVYGAWDDAIKQVFGLRKIPSTQITKDIDLVDAAFKNARGSVDQVHALLHQAGRGDLSEAVRTGIMDGFVSNEQMMKAWGRSKGWKKFWDVYNMPAAMFQGVEQRMRLGNFLELTQGAKKMHADQAAQLVKETFLDYANHGSNLNRTLRDLIPFIQFQIKSIPQQAKFMARNPAYAVGLSNLNQDDPNHPIMPWMEGKTNIRVGKDKKGDDLYATGLGLPYESLNMIPDSARSFKKNIVGSSHPVLKSLLAKIMDQDSYFETPYGEYDKIPAFGHQGKLGQAYNQIAGYGVLQPIDALLRMAGKATDVRHTGAQRAADLLTGINFRSVDPDQAEIQQLLEQLKGTPGVGQFSTPYQQDKDNADLDALFDELKAAKKRVKAKKP